MEVWGYFLKKQKLCMQSLTKEWKQPPVVILQQLIFYNISIWCLWLSIIRRSDQGVQFMNFPSQIFFNDINRDYRAAILKKSYLWVCLTHMVMSTYCYYEKVCRTMHTAIVLYLLQKESQLNEVCLGHNVRCTVFIRQRTHAQLLMIYKISTYFVLKRKFKETKNISRHA